MIRKRTHFQDAKTTEDARWKIRSFANDLGLLTEMLSQSLTRLQPPARELLDKHFKEGTPHGFTQDEFRDFTEACGKAYRCESTDYGVSLEIGGNPLSSTYALFFKFFRKTRRQPFFVFHGRFDLNGKFQSFVIEKRKD